MEEIELDFGAITIDNSTLKSEGYRFHEGLLAQMEQFIGSPVKVLQTDVVHNEAIKHIGQEISNTRSSVEKALRSVNKQLKIKPEIIESARSLLSVQGSENEIAESRLKEFYDFIGVEIINSHEYVNLSDLMEMYFSTCAPFENGNDKKNEFPDAIALLALEGWAEKNDVNIIAVSQDKGWSSYANESTRIRLVRTLAEALEKFQPHNRVASIIDKIREDSLLDDGNHLLEKIESALIESVNGYDIEVDAYSNMYFEWDDVSADYVSHQLDCDQEGFVRIRVVRISDDTIVLKLGATVEVEISTNFDFSIRDPIDKDYLSVGGNIFTTIESYHTDILLTLAGDFSQGFDEIKAADVEILEAIAYVNFGEVEPDWRSEYGKDDL